MQPEWNEIVFRPWARGNLNISVNKFGHGPIVLELEGDGRETCDLDEWMTPEEARELSAKLIEAAGAAETAGRYKVTSS